MAGGGPSAGGSWAALWPLASRGGVFFSYSFAGLAWPVAILGLWAVRRRSAARCGRGPCWDICGGPLCCWRSSSSAAADC